MKRFATRVPRMRWLVLIASLVFVSAFLVPLNASALTDTDLSISKRLRLAEQHCEEDGGGELDIAYSYEDDVLVAATTTCEGGIWDGQVCVHEQDTVDCYTAPSLTQTTEPIAPGAGDTADPGENPRSQSTVLDQNTAHSDGAAEDPTRGEEMTSSSRATTDEVVLACESLGGVATVDTHGGIGYTNVHCRGGVLDGTTCIVGHYDTYCPFFFIGTELDAMTPETMPDLLVDPDRDGNVVVMSQHVDIDDAADAAGTLCEGFGGTSSEHHEWELGFEHIVATSCEGGLLDGMNCTHYYNDSVCVFRAIEPDSVKVDPSAGNEIPADSAPAAPSPTAMPTQVVDVSVTPTPTMEPTVTPAVEPTVMPTADPTVAPTEPVDPPTFPTPPTDDVVVPPGEAEDPVVEPTPTVVVLT